jgi:hypothetical protein
VGDNSLRYAVVVRFRQEVVRSTVSRVYDRESLSAVDGLVLDLEPQPPLDHLAELAVLGRVIRIGAEQELLIVRVEKRLPAAQGSCMRPDIQILLSDASVAGHVTDRQSPGPVDRVWGAAPLAASAVSVGLCRAAGLSRVACQAYPVRL